MLVTQVNLIVLNCLNEAHHNYWIVRRKWNSLKKHFCHFVQLDWLVWAAFIYICERLLHCFHFPQIYWNSCI